MVGLHPPLLWALCILAIGVNVSLARRYRNWHVLRVGPLSARPQVKAMTEFMQDYETNENVIVLADVITSKDPIEVIVSPYELNHVTSYLEATSIPYNVTSKDLQRSLIRERQVNAAADRHMRRRRSVKENVVELPHFYMHYEQMNDYIFRLVNASKGRAEVVQIGQSYEGRDMYCVKVNNGTGKPKVWIDAGIHAREWIAPATALHLLHQLVFNESEEVRKVADAYQWYILPLTNPDGYHFTWTDDRLWRKNRRPNGPCPDPCKEGIGVDLNRNFNFNWGLSSHEDPCLPGFHGRAPFSEPESRAMRDFLLAERRGMHVYFSLHAFFQYFILPWVGANYRAPDYPELERVANISCQAMYDVHGEIYDVVNFPEELYLASGSSMDWAKATAGVKYSYTIELRPNTRQPHFAVSFQLQPDQIRPTGEEVLAGVLTTARLVKERLDKVGENGL